MRNKIGSTLWGLLLITAGVVFLGNAMDWWSITLFVKGWWTLFIIVPCLISIFQSGFQFGNIFGIAAGVTLFLSANNIITDKAIWPLFIIAAGVMILFPSIFSKRLPAAMGHLPLGKKTYNAVFSGANVRADGETFEGATINTTFGGIDLDLRNAVIEKDVMIQATCIFGGGDIFLPGNVRVQVGGTHILGGVDNKFRNSTEENAPLVYIDATCIFGGIDIK